LGEIDNDFEGEDGDVDIEIEDRREGSIPVGFPHYQPSPDLPVASKGDDGTGAEKSPSSSEAHSGKIQSRQHFRRLGL
jgi:hypothetical protein